MNIEVSPYSGFCFGVARAVKLLDKALETSDNVYSVGEIIHNSVFNEKVKLRGLTVLNEDEISKLTKNDYVIIRSHGIKADIEEIIKKIGCQIIDATCPDVKKIHRIVYDNTNEDTFLIVIGDSAHPEVTATVSRANCEYAIYKDYGELAAESDIDLILKNKYVIMVAQTTHSVSDYKKCKEFIKKVYTKAKIFDTICNVTESRQHEADSLSKRSDVMLVVGGKSSSNTLKLFNICKQNCKRTYFVENVCDVPELEDGLNIGIAAGASTPEGLIEEVINKCQKK